AAQPDRQLPPSLLEATDDVELPPGAHGGVGHARITPVCICQLTAVHSAGHSASTGRIGARGASVHTEGSASSTSPSVTPRTGVERGPPPGPCALARRSPASSAARP